MTPDGTKWTRLVLGNDWGSQYWMHPAWKSSTANARAQAAAFGPTVRVRWPDGEVTTEPVEHEGCTDHVSDHGHTSTVESRVPCIILRVPPRTYHGYPLDPQIVRFSDVDVDPASLRSLPMPGVKP